MLQALEHRDQRFTDAQEAADHPGAAGQAQGLVQMVEGRLALLALPEQLSLEDMVAVLVHHQLVALGIHLQLAQDRQRALALVQRQVGAHMVARIALGEVVGPRFERRRGAQPLADAVLVLGRVPVGEHHRMGIGQPVDMVVVAGQQALDLADIVGAHALLAAGVGDPGEQHIALQKPVIAHRIEDLQALQGALLDRIQVVPLEQHLAAHAVDELHDRGHRQLFLLDVLQRPFLQVVGLLQMALGDGDLRQLAEAPQHRVGGIDLLRAAHGFLVLLLGLLQLALDEMHLGQHRHRRHPRGAHGQRFEGQGLTGEGHGLLQIALVDRHLGAHRLEIRLDALPLLRAVQALLRRFAGLQPALDLVALILVLRGPGLQQGEQRRLGDGAFRQYRQAALQQGQAALAIELATMRLEDLGQPLRIAGQYRVARRLLRHLLLQQRLGGAQVQFGDPLWLMGAQLVLQKAGEQRMVGEPLAQAVDGLDKQAGTLQRLEHLAAVAALGQAVGQGRAETLEQAGGLEEFLGWCVQTFEHLFAQVIADIGMAKLQALEEQVHAAPGLHFLLGQLQGAGPAADAPVEALDLLAIDRDRQAQRQQLLHLVVLEGQQAGIQRQQLALDPQFGDTEFRQAAAAHQQGQPCRAVA